jgi:hypothetical protein
MRRFAGTLGDYHIRAGNLLGETERIYKTGQKNDARVGLKRANAFDEFASIHARHAEVGYHHVEGGALEEFQTLFAITGELHVVTNFFEERSADQQSVSVVVYQQNVRGRRLGGFHQCEGESNRAVTAMSMLLASSWKTARWRS